MSDKKSRAYLKTLFRAGRIPTDADFVKLIDSTTNAADDRIVYRQNGSKGDSICIGAGDNQVLMSFFASLSQAGSNWTLELNPQNTLSFHTKNRATPVLSMDQLGRVGIGTDRPSTTLDVQGDISATNQSLQGHLYVQGTATVGALRIPGLGTIEDLESLRNLLGLSAPAPTSAETPAAPVEDPVTEQNTSIPVNSGFFGISVNTTPPVRHEAPKMVVLDDSPAAKSWSTCSVMALRRWQNVLGPFTGAKAVELIALLDGPVHRSITYLTAVNIDGDPNSAALHHVHSYQGRPGSKVYFRWEKDGKAYFLQCRTAVHQPHDTAINFYFSILL